MPELGQQNTCFMTRAVQLGGQLHSAMAVRAQWQERLYKCSSHKCTAIDKDTALLESSSHVTIVRAAHLDTRVLGRMQNNVLVLVVRTQCTVVC